ncbi:MAG: diguanylate cyclase, partial [Anaerolineales bacterium]
MLLVLSRATSDVLRAKTPTEIFKIVGEKLTGLHLHVVIFDLIENQSQLVVHYLDFDRSLLKQAEEIAGITKEAFRYPLREGDIFHRVVQTGKAIFHDRPVEMMAAGLPEDKRDNASLVAALLGLEQTIVAPLIVGGETIGLMEIIGKALTEADIPAVMTFASQISIALENAELQKQAHAYAIQLERRVLDLDALNTVAASVHQSLDVEEILDQAMQNAIPLAEADAAGITLVDMQAGEAILVAHKGLNGILPPAAHKMKISRGWTGQLLSNGEPFVIGRRDQHPSLVRDFLEKEDIESVAAVPLIGQQGVIGMLVVGSCKINHFDAQAVDLLTNLGRQLAIGIEKARLHQAVRASKERYQSLFDGVPVALLRTTPAGKILDINQAAVELFGFEDREALLQSSALSLYPDPEDRKQWIEAMEQHGQVVDHEVQLQRRDGEKIWVSYKSQATLDRNGKIAFIDSSAEDITEQRQLEERLHYLSYHDALTGLYNRGFFEEELERHERGRKFPISLIVADVDDLKSINDNLGHAHGDEILQRAAALFSSVLRADDIVARIGGDEFAVILPQTDVEQADFVLRRLADRLKLANADSDQIPLRLSFGAATANLGTHLNDVLKQADESMYHEKRNHKGNRDGISTRTDKPESDSHQSK